MAVAAIQKHGEVMWRTQQLAWRWLWAKVQVQVQVQVWVRTDKLTPLLPGMVTVAMTVINAVDTLKHEVKAGKS